MSTSCSAPASRVPRVGSPPMLRRRAVAPIELGQSTRRQDHPPWPRWSDGWPETMSRTTAPDGAAVPHDDIGDGAVAAPARIRGELPTCRRSVAATAHRIEEVDVTAAADGCTGCGLLLRRSPLRAQRAPRSFHSPGCGWAPAREQGDAAARHRPRPAATVSAACTVQSSGSSCRPAATVICAMIVAPPRPTTPLSTSRTDARHGLRRRPRPMPTRPRRQSARRTRHASLAACAPARYPGVLESP